MPFSFDHKRCLACGREFKYQRSTAKYCSDKCRKKAERGDTLAGRLDKSYTAAAAQIDALGLWVGRGGDLDAIARNRLNKLITRAQAALSDTTLHNRAGIKFFVCQECGQSFFGNEPPGYCSFCGRETEWELSPLSPNS